MRLAITGGPKTGKTTLSQKFGCPIRHCDNLIKLGWSEASQVASFWFDDPGSWVVEGVMVPRALRKWLSRHREGKPCDKVIWLTEFKVLATPGHKNMTSGMRAVWAEIEPELRRRGVEIEYK